MTERTKRFLEELDELLAQHDTTAEEVAHVLTALRGPDNQQDGLKSVTTNVIRTVALPKTAKRGHVGMSFHTTAKFGVPRTLPALGNGFISGHFLTHIEKAAKVLGVPFRKL